MLQPSNHFEQSRPLTMPPEVRERVDQLLEVMMSNATTIYILDGDIDRLEAIVQGTTTWLCREVQGLQAVLEARDGAVLGQKN